MHSNEISRIGKNSIDLKYKIKSLHSFWCKNVAGVDSNRATTNLIFLSGKNQPKILFPQMDWIFIQWPNPSQFLLMIGPHQIGLTLCLSQTFNNFALQTLFCHILNFEFLSLIPFGWYTIITCIIQRLWGTSTLYIDKFYSIWYFVVYCFQSLIQCRWRNAKIRTLLTFVYHCILYILHPNLIDDHIVYCTLHTDTLHIRNSCPN